MINLPGVQFMLGEDIEMLRDAVATFAAKEITPRAAEVDRTDQFPMDLWKKFGDLGVLGMTVAEEYGGANMGYRAHGRDGRDLARIGIDRPVVRRALEPVREPDPPQRHGSAKAEIPAEARVGRNIGALAMSEPNAARRRQHEAARRQARPLRAERHEDVDHERPRLRHARRHAKTDVEANSRGITAFIVEKGMKGFSVAQSSTSSACAARTRASWCSRTSKCRKKTSSASSTAA